MEQLSRCTVHWDAKNQRIYDHYDSNGIYYFAKDVHPLVNRIAELEATLDAINGTSTLDLFFGALGWKGGTIHDAVETVRNQKKRIEELEMELAQWRNMETSKTAVWQNIISGRIARPSALDHYEECKETVERQAQCIKEMRKRLDEDATLFENAAVWHHDRMLTAPSKQARDLQAGNARRNERYARQIRAVLERWPK